MRIFNHRLFLGKENPYLRILQGEEWIGDNEIMLKFISGNYFFRRWTQLLILLGDLQPFVSKAVQWKQHGTLGYRQKMAGGKEDLKIWKKEKCFGHSLDTYGCLVGIQTWPRTQTDSYHSASRHLPTLVYPFLWTSPLVCLFPIAS